MRHTAPGSRYFLSFSPGVSFFWLYDRWKASSGRVTGVVNPGGLSLRSESLARMPRGSPAAGTRVYPNIVPFWWKQRIQWEIKKREFADERRGCSKQDLGGNQF